MPSLQVSPAERLLALDQLRGFVITLVVLHHAVLAYCTFGHIDRINYVLSTAPIVDARRWIGFDRIVVLNDGFFMPLLFLLSGLFVWDSLTRKTPWCFLRERLLRLGLPFAVAELTLMPLAYYPSFLQAGGAPGVLGFWTQTVTRGPWPSGPPWFIGILLLFDAAAALIFALPPRTLPLRATKMTPRPTWCFGLLLIGSFLLYVPLLIAFGPSHWVAVGPVAIQVSRAFLYAAYFAVGVALGANGTAGIKRLGQVVARGWTGWVILSLLAGIALLGIPWLLGLTSGRLPRWADIGVVGLGLTTYCTATCFAVPAMFLRFGGHPGPVWTSLAANSFAIYLLHYPVVTWTQYALLSIPVSALAKGIATFGIALSMSWVAAISLRKLPGGARAM